MIKTKIPERERKEKEESHGENWGISFLRDLEMKEATYEREGGEKTWINQNQES